MFYAGIKISGADLLVNAELCLNLLKSVKSCRNVANNWIKEV